MQDDLDKRAFSMSKSSSCILLAISLFFIILPVGLSQMENVTVDMVNMCRRLESQPPTLNVFGTEYNFNDSGKTFLQVVDNGQFISNASCTLNIWFPNTTTKFIDNQLMIQHDDGLQFVPFTVPEIEGIYMVSAQCLYFIENNFIYEEDSLNIINVSVISGSYSGNPIVLNNRMDGLINSHTSTIGGGTKFVTANYEWNSFDLVNATGLSFQWLGASDTTSISTTFSYFNWSSATFVDINIIILSGTTQSVLEYNTGSIPLDGINISSGNGTVRLQISGSSNNNFVLVHDWLVLHSAILTNQSINNLRGSGELHVSNNINEGTNNILEVLTMSGQFISFTLIIIGSAILLIFFEKVIALWLAFFGFVVSITGFFSLNQQILVIICALFGMVSILKLLVVYAQGDPDNVSIIKIKEI